MTNRNELISSRRPLHFNFSKPVEKWIVDIFEYMTKRLRLRFTMWLRPMPSLCHTRRVRCARTTQIMTCSYFECNFIQFKWNENNLKWVRTVSIHSLKFFEKRKSILFTSHAHHVLVHIRISKPVHIQHVNAVIGSHSFLRRSKTNRSVDA